VDMTKKLTWRQCKANENNATPSALPSHSAPSFKVTLAPRISYNIWTGREGYWCYIVRTRDDYDWEVGLDFKRGKLGNLPFYSLLSLRYNKVPPVEDAPSYQCKDEGSTSRVSVKISLSSNVN